MRSLISTLIISLLAVGCKENSAEPEAALQAPADTTTVQAAPIEDQQEARYTPVDGSLQVHNERYGFTFTIPGQYKAIDKSNNGDGYFIESGDAGTDIRIYGENITDNTVAAELALSACNRTEKFRFDNGYPGIKCFQGDDMYYYYDTPTLRITLYVHASDRWKERNAGVIQSIAGSIHAGDTM